MSGLLRRLRRGRDGGHTDSHAAGEDVTGVYAGDHAHAEAATAVHEADPGTDRHENGDDLDELVGRPPTARRRGRLRRRLRHVRRVRELLLRDLGGFVLELHRAEERETGSGVVDAKLRRLQVVDAEIRELEALLDDRRPLVVRQPGIGGACPQCGEIFGSEARFCWACGTAVAAGSGALPLIAPSAARPELAAPAGAETGHPGTIDASAEPTEADASAEPATDTNAEPTEADTNAEPTEADTNAEPTEADTNAEPTEADTSAEPTRPDALVPEPPGEVTDATRAAPARESDPTNVLPEHPASDDGEESRG